MCVCVCVCVCVCGETDVPTEQVFLLGAALSRQLRRGQDSPSSSQHGRGQDPQATGPLGGGRLLVPLGGEASGPLGGGGYW